MPRNEVTLQSKERKHPIDENLRPLKVGGKDTAISVAQRGNGALIDGDLQVTGSVPSDATKLSLSGGTMTGDIATSSDFTLDVGGDLTLDASGNDIYLETSGSQFGVISSTGTRSLKLYEALGSSVDYGKLGTTVNGLTVLSTVDAAGSDADLRLDIDGDITLDSETGVFILKKSGKS